MTLTVYSLTGYPSVEIGFSSESLGSTFTLAGQAVPASFYDGLGPVFYDIPPGNYTVSNVSGGPAANYTISPAPAQPLGADPTTGANTWNVTFTIAFTSNPSPSPFVTTLAASGVDGGDATLQGTVNPNGVATSAWFEWGTDAGLANAAQTPSKPMGSGTNPTSITFPLNTLGPNTTYFYRLVGSGPSGASIPGLPQSFTTLGTLPAPTLQVPANQASGVPTPPSFGWSPVSTATSYRLIAATSPAALPSDPASATCGTGCVLDVTPVGTAYTPPEGVLQTGTTYYWEVHARSPSQYGNWSNTFSFATAGPGLTSITISPATITSGAQASVTVTLNGPAPAGGATVNVTSSSPSAFPANSSVPIAAGNTTATISVTAGSVSASTTVTVSATYGSSTVSGLVTVAPSGGSVSLSSFTITPPTIAGGYATQGNVFLTGPAPAGGATVNLSSNNPSFAQVPATQTATVQAGYTSVGFPITTSFTSATEGATITASYNNTMYGATVTVVPVVATGVTFYPSSVNAGAAAQFTVYLNGPAPAGASVSLTSSNTSVLQVPATVPVPAGGTSISVTGTTLAISSQASATVTATYNGGSAQGSVTVFPLTLVGLDLNTLEVTGGSSVTGTVWLSGAAPAGIAVSLSSNSTSVQVPSLVNFAQGSPSATFTATTSAVSSVTNVTITASYGSLSYSLTLTLVPPLPFVASLSFSPATVVSGSNTTGTVTLTSPAPLDASVVLLTSSFPALINLYDVVVQPGATSATFNIATPPISFIAPVTITGTYNGSSQGAVVTIVPPGTPLAPSSLTLSPSVATGGLPVLGTVALTGPAPAGGATLSLSSDNASVQVSPVLTVPQGLGAATFAIVSSPVSTVTTATIRVTYDGLSQTSLLTLEPSGGPPSGNPVPLLTAPLTPVSQPPGSSAPFLTINGAGFVPGSQAYWNGTTVPTTYLTGSQLQVSIPAGMSESNGSAIVVVRNPGLVTPVSNALPEYLTYSTPSPSFNPLGLTASGTPENVTVADLNGDGKPDLLVGGNASNEFSVFLGNGDGTFGPEFLVQGFSQPAVGDFNGDGKLDVMTTVGFPATSLRLYLGNGDGTFSRTQDIASFSGSISNVVPAFGDFNGDGKLDIAVTGTENNASHVYVLLGNGDGTFQPAAAFGSFNQPVGLTLADFNGDGKLDLAVANTANSTISILLGNGDGTFQQQIEYPANGYPYFLVAADFNGDGHPDIAVGNGGPVGGTAGGVAILLNNGDGTFATAVNYAPGTVNYWLSTDDMNGDGKLDLVVPSINPNRQTLIFLGNGDGTFATSPIALSTGPGVWANAIADLNGDGAPDIVVADYESGSLSILLQSVAPILQIAPASLSYTAVQGSGGPSSQSLTISNTGSGTLSWTATTSQPWVVLSQNTGTAPASLAVSANPSGLAVGTYNATITVAATGASNSPQTVAVTLTVDPAPVVVSSLVFAPATIVGAGASNGTITLSGPAPAAGAIVALSSNSSILQVPSTVTIAAGLISAGFTATASAPSTQTVATVTASYNGSATTATLTVQPGVPAATISPAALTFGAVAGSTSVVKTVTLTNSGTAPLALSKIAASGDYIQGNKCPASLTPGAACIIEAVFRPTAAGYVLGALTIADSAANSPQVVSLTGVGVNMLSTSAASITFGTVTVGTTSQPQTLTLTNNSATSVSFNLAASPEFTVSGNGTAPCGTTLAVRKSCTAAITFTPSQNGPVSGTVALSGAGFPARLVTLTGSGTGGAPSPFAFSPGYANFAGQEVGITSSNQVVTVTNNATVSVNIISLAASANFAVSGGAVTPCGGALAAHATCTFSVTFTPSVAGAARGSVAVITNAKASPLIYALVGTGVPPVTINPASLAFGPQGVGTTSPAQTVTLQNNQAAVLNLASFTGSGNYAVVAGGSAPCGASVTAHATCTFQVTFTPTSAGKIDGAIAIVDDASGSPQVLSLAGVAQ